MASALKWQQIEDGKGMFQEMVTDGKPVNIALLMKLLVMLVYYVCNFILVLSLIIAIFRIFSFGAIELQNAYSLLTSIFGFAYFQKFTFWLFKADSRLLQSLSVTSSTVILIVNALIFVAVIIMHWYLIPKISEWNYNRGISEYNKGNYASALDAFGKAITQNPDNQRCYLGIARVYEALANTEEAIYYYQLSMSKVDRNYSAYNDLARLYMENPETYTKALNLLLKLQVDFKNDAVERPNQEKVKAIIDKNLSWVFWKLGLHAESKKKIILSVASLKKMQGALDEHPSVYCLYALNHLAENRNANIEQLCLNKFDKLVGAEVELYVELEKLLH